MSSASVSAAPGARRPRRRPGENRAGLIAAGTIEFGLHGYAGAQTSAIASRAGVSQPNVYANFSSKRELFLACVHELLQAVADGRTVLTGDDARDLASPPLTQERVLLVFQAVAAAREPSLAPDLGELLAELHSRLGSEALAALLLRAATLLVDPAAGE